MGMQLRSPRDQRGFEKREDVSRTGMRALRLSNIKDIIDHRNAAVSGTIEGILTTHKACIDRFYFKGLESAKEKELTRLQEEERMKTEFNAGARRIPSEYRHDDQILSQLYNVHFHKNVKKL